ncbi:MAG: hypothetical protein EAZ95_02380 [Bacteroidetes bacterium]|nr:MAG: hypothetical protein EAZ95_02380 [Bacteroidota bacterium]
MISTQNLSALPAISAVRHTCKALATLEAIVCPEWEFRYYSYNAFWDKDAKEEVASMRDGEGDEFFILFNQAGAVINGFAIDSDMNGWVDDNTQEIWEGVIDSVPQEFLPFIQTEPIPSIGTTFCIWRKHTDSAWQVGKIDFPTDDDYGDGSGEMLDILDGKPATYHAFAEAYYERPIPLAWIEYVYAHKPLTREAVLALNPSTEDWDALSEDLQEIDYPFQF